MSLRSLLENTAVALSSFLSVEDAPVPAEFCPSECQELEPHNHRAAIAISILFNSVYVHLRLATPLLLTPTANLCPLLTLSLPFFC